MYYHFYGLQDSPFALTPDPKYLFLSASHKEALASIIYGVHERQGFVLIVGEVGTGKTTLIRYLLGQRQPHIKTAFVYNTTVNVDELLQMVLRNLELPCQSRQRFAMLDAMQDYLLQEAAAGRQVMLIIDEAQHLAVEVLEALRMLSNIETAQHSAWCNLRLHGKTHVEYSPDARGPPHAFFSLAPGHAVGWEEDSRA